MFSGRGQPSCEQLIDRCRISCRPVRDVLVDYLRERQPAVDFSTLQRLAYLLGKLFWADLEAHHPGIDSPQLPRDVAAAWKQRVLTRPKATKDKGQVSGPRLDGRSVLTAVWAFYLDLAAWADDDPARWGRGRSGVRSEPATPPTRRPACTASPAWTPAPADDCRCCRPWSPGWRPNEPASSSCSPPPKKPGPAGCSPSPGQPCVERY
jgi:hypothetical protein